MPGSTVQYRNDQLVDILSTDFIRRNDPSFFVSYLRADVAATSVSIQVSAPYTRISAYDLWVVIDVGTIECEVRRVTAIGGGNRTYTIGALAYDHYLGDPVLFLSVPRLSLLWWGAKGDAGVTDNLIPINNALIQAGTAGGGTGNLIVPPGYFGTTDQVNVPVGVEFLGLTPIGGTGQKSRSCILAMAGFPAATPLIRMGTTGSYQNGIRLNGLFIDCDEKADIGVYSEVIAEHSMIEKCWIIDAVEKGIFIDSSPAGEYASNYFIRDTTVTFNNAAGTEKGIHIIGGPSATGNFSHMRGGSSISINANTAITAGIHLENYAGGMWDRIHVEKCDKGVLLGGATTSCRAVTLMNVFGVSCTDVINVANNANTDDITIISAFRSGGTNLINDNLTPEALTAFRVGLYQIAGNFYLLGRGYRQPFDLWFQDNVAANQTAVLLGRTDHQAPPAAYPNQLIVGRPGSVTAIWVRLTAAWSAGTLTLTLYKNNVATAMTVVIDGSATQNNTTLAVKGTYNFAAYDRLDLRVTTDGAWAPTTADLRGGIEVET